MTVMYFLKKFINPYKRTKGRGNVMITDKRHQQIFEGGKIDEQVTVGKSKEVQVQGPANRKTNQEQADSCSRTFKRHG